MELRPVYKVNYLRARARWDRWQEELILVKKEMEWRITWFEHAHEVWTKRSKLEDMSEGAKVYAKLQAQKWGMFATRSRRAFGQYLGNAKLRR
ncbi:hypothetical protein K435DRAFT_697752 [Dendrothele bispora CBS 962.96]|uniref:Uncharacterized protein n=1 Tax=Dendrothele bispora (strain CBS 962.96) TaxID=1314807 RepID=A0A4S8KUD3_DENBC|nr:hypothetical protein K435DRAFT_697752 [Dendrothele bispora CBS 962.96]